MSKVLTDDKLEKANAPETVTFTVDQVKQMGFEDVATFQNIIKEAGDTREIVSKVFPELITAMAGLQKAMAEKEESIRGEHDGDQFDELSRSKFVKMYQSLPENDELRTQIKSELLAEFKMADVELVLEKDELTKALIRPLSSRTKNVEEIKEFRKGWDAVQIFAALKGGISANTLGSDEMSVNRDTISNAAKKLDDLDFPGMENVQKTIIKAMSDTNSVGGEWIPSILSADFINEVLLQLLVVPQFQRYNMPSPTFSVPTVSGGIRGYLIDENITDTNVGSATPFFSNFVQASSAGSSKITFNARKFGALTFVSDEIQEDSIVPTIEIVQEKMARGMAERSEERRVGKECTSWCRSRWSPYH